MLKTQKKILTKLMCRNSNKRPLLSKCLDKHTNPSLSSFTSTSPSCMEDEIFKEASHTQKKKKQKKQRNKSPKIYKYNYEKNAMRSTTMIRG